MVVDACVACWFAWWVASLTSLCAGRLATLRYWLCVHVSFVQLVACWLLFFCGILLLTLSLLLYRSRSVVVWTNSGLSFCHNDTSLIQFHFSSVSRRYSNSFATYSIVSFLLRRYVVENENTAILQ